MTIPAPASSPIPVSPELISHLQSIGTRAQFSAGEPVMQEGEAGTGIYLLLHGRLSLSVSPQEGVVIPLRMLGPGAFIGLSSTLSCDHCCYTVKAVENSELTFVSSEAVHDLLRKRPDLCLQIIQLLGQEMNSVCAERAFVNARLQPVQIGGSSGAATDE